jgi:endonuclease YncB( thermonuclease family)
VKRQRVDALVSLALAILLLLFAYYPQHSPSHLYSVARVYKVIDGDTVWVTSLWGYESSVRFKVRFLGIDAPELSTAAGKRSKQELNTLIPPGTCVVLGINPYPHKDKYGRVLAVVYLLDLNAGRLVNVNAYLVRHGLAQAVDYGDTDLDWALNPSEPIPDELVTAIRSCIEK